VILVAVVCSRRVAKLPIRGELGSPERHTIVYIFRGEHTNLGGLLSARIVTGKGKGDEGTLDLHQVLDLDLRKTNLVVLSGCQSQMGARTSGDDVIAFSRAFMYAGSSSVMASLWSIDDEATERPMVAFYTPEGGLEQSGSPAPRPNGCSAEVPSSLLLDYWAGFVLTGDPGSTGGSNLVASSGK
jgi:hypothetical protein